LILGASRRGRYTARPVSRPRLLLATLLCASALARAQGTVQLRDPRRPPPLDPPPECDLWRGHITGNDPSAEATLQLCTTGDAVTGVFLWSSLESGWNRRRFDGRWLDARQRLVLHDTAMLENHPADGWRLCLADRYDLRRVSDAELAGEFWSQACDDHGTMRITRLAQPAPPELTTPAPTPAPTPARGVDEPLRRRRVLGCGAAPGGASGGATMLWGVALLGAAAISRSRCWRGRR
jgi:hypothetical protein